MSQRPSWDPARRRLRLSARQLGVLAGLARGVPADDGDAAALELLEAGVIASDGTLPASLQTAAAAAAGARAEVGVTRLARDGEVRVSLTWGEDGVVVTQARAADEVGDVIVQPPTHLARAIWRVLQLGPRSSSPDRAALELEGAALFAPFLGDRAPWTDTLDVQPETLVLDRLDVVADPLRPPASWVVLDAGVAGLWDLIPAETGDRARLTPTSPAAAYAAIAALQPVPEPLR